MKHVKMVITDMDGTLLNSNHEVSETFFKIFKKLKQHGIHFVAASGRPYYSIIDKFEPIKNDITIVAENGGLVLQKDNLLLSNIIKKEQLKELYTLVNSIRETYPIFCTKNKAYIKRTSDELVTIFSEYYCNFTIIDTFEEIEDDVIKIALYHTSNSEEHIYPHVEHLKDHFNVVVSGNHWVDISDKVTNKGHAIKFLQKHYNIDPSETMAFGDYNNDFEMLQQALFSYAMANAHDNIKSIAKYLTKSNDELGVEYILDQLVSESSKN